MPASLTEIDRNRYIRERLYPRWGELADYVFGLLCLGMFLFGLVAFLNHKLDGASLIWLAVFPIVNVASTRLIVRASLSHQLLLEIFRLFAVNGVLCALLYVKVGGPLAPFSVPYLIMALGSPSALVSQRAPNWLGYAPAVFWPLNLLLTSWLFHVESAIYGAGVKALAFGTVSLFGMFIARAMTQLAATNHQRSQELETALESLRATQAQLIHAGRLAAFGEMAGELAHEINNPLAILQLNVQLLKKLTVQGVATGQTLSILDRLTESGDRMATIVKSLQDIPPRDIMPHP